MSNSPILRPGALNGFTLIELVATLTVAAILAMIAMPAYQQFIASGRLTAATNDLVADLSYARIEAMKRGAGITQAAPCARSSTAEGQAIVCASADGATCATAPTTWNAGWMMYWNYDGTGANYNAGNCDALLKVHAALPSDVTVTTAPAGVNKLLFDRIGTLNTTITSLQLSDAKSNKSTLICLSGGTGRAMVANNSSVACP